MEFIYVMNDENRDIMIELGYTLIKANKERHVWVFRNKDELRFDKNGDKALTDAGITCFCYSDILTF